MRFTLTIKQIIAFLLISLISVVGSSVMAAENQPPLIAPLSDRYVLEGNQLNIEISAYDPDGDAVSLVALSRPTGSRFVDNGDGTATFSWMPDYVGPNSSQGSPFRLVIAASDGISMAQRTVDIIVLNNNRPPHIIAPDTVTISAGEELSFAVSGYDEDFDELSWKVISAPFSVKSTETKNTASFSWVTTYADSGIYSIQVAVSDVYGAADTADITLNVKSTEVYALSIDTISAYPSDYVTIGINLKNLELLLQESLTIFLKSKLKMELKIYRCFFDPVKSKIRIN